MTDAENKWKEFIEDAVDANCPFVMGDDESAEPPEDFAIESCNEVLKAYKAALREAIESCIKGAKQGLNGSNKDAATMRIKGYEFFLELLDTVTPDGEGLKSNDDQKQNAGRD